MEIRPIKTEQDYDAALAEIEALWGAEVGSPEGDKLDVLLILADAYEAKHHPIPLPDPVEAILFRMEQAGLQRKDLERGIPGTVYLSPRLRESAIRYFRARRFRRAGTGRKDDQRPAPSIARNRARCDQRARASCSAHLPPQNPLLQRLVDLGLPFAARGAEVLDDLRRQSQRDQNGLFGIRLR